MSPNNRILINTCSQYFRAITNTILSLYSTRIILAVLGMSDYGIYAVVGGVVALLGFITNALIITTQRYISYHSGKDDITLVRSIFSNSLFLHLIIGLLLVIILLSIKLPVFEYILNIEEHRISTAADIYILTIGILFLTIITAPFKAVYIANENIVFISVIEILDGILRLAVAFIILAANADKLLLYGILMLCISLLNFVIFSSYALHRYPECHIRGMLRDINKTTFLQLSGFAGWTTYGMGAIVLRNQGVAITINHFLGTIVNAAYGLANQLYGSLAIIATSILNAMNPQIMQAEGRGERQRMLWLAGQESKYTELLLLLLLTPLLFEMPQVLHFWLGQASPDTIMICRFILVGFMFDQLTYGLNTANQALGKVRNYCLLIYTPKLLILPLSYAMFHYGLGLLHTMWLFISIELFVSLLRLPYMRHTAGLSISNFAKQVFLPVLPMLTVQCIVGYMITNTVAAANYRFILTFVSSCITGSIIIFFFSLTKPERSFAIDLARKGWKLITSFSK